MALWSKPDRSEADWLPEETAELQAPRDFGRSTKNEGLRRRLGNRSIPSTRMPLTELHELAVRRANVSTGRR